MRRRLLLLLAILVGLGFIVARSRRAALAPEPDHDPWSTERHAEAGAGWLEPVEGDCPPSHPVKAKMTSGIYHLPGMVSYARTNPDRCYRDAATAEADGLRPAKR